MIGQIVFVAHSCEANFSVHAKTTPKAWCWLVPSVSPRVHGLVFESLSMISMINHTIAYSSLYGSEGRNSFAWSCLAWSQSPIKIIFNDYYKFYTIRVINCRYIRFLWSKPLHKSLCNYQSESNQSHRLHVWSGCGWICWSKVAQVGYNNMLGDDLI